MENQQEDTIVTLEDGREFVAETHAVVTDTAADGTETVAEITVTVSPDDPTHVESHMFVTETAPDGTETVTEVIADETGQYIVEPESDFEQIVEATFGVEIPDELTPVEMPDNTQNAEAVSEFGYYGNPSETENAGFMNAEHETFDGGNFGSYEASAVGGFETAGSGDNFDDLYSVNTGLDLDYTSAITGDQTDAEYTAEYNAGWQNYEQDQADIAHDTMVDYAAHGDYDAASVYAESAENHQAAADEWSHASDE